MPDITGASTALAQKEFLSVLSGLDRHYDDDIGANRLLETFTLFKSTYRGGAVLEIGSWPGDFAICLKRLGFDVSGVDIDPDRVAERLAREHVPVKRCDVERDNLPFPDGTFDYVFLTEVIEHLYANPLHALAELHRVLRPNGLMLVSTPNLTRWENRVLFALGRPLISLSSPYDAFLVKRTVGHMGHLRLFSPPELQVMLRETGFRLLTERFVDLEQPAVAEARVVKPRITEPPPSLARRIFRRRPLADYAEALGVRLGALLKRQIPQFRGHLFVLVERTSSGAAV